MKRFYIRVALAAAGILSVGVGALAFQQLGAFRKWSFVSPARRILATFEAGSVPEKWSDADAKADVVRDAHLIDMQGLLRPRASNAYGIVVGEHGTGKSTLVRQAARSVAPGQANGVVCIDVDDVPNFGMDLAATLGISGEDVSLEVAARRRLMMVTKEESPFDLSTEPLTSWLRVRAPLDEAARLFFAKYQRPMTLVIDGADALAKEQPLFLDRLQDYAKATADAGHLRVVFVSSDKTAIARMKPRASWTRSLVPLEVGDVSDADAVAFLVKRGLCRVSAGRCFCAS